MTILLYHAERLMSTPREIFFCFNKTCSSSTRSACLSAKFFCPKRSTKLPQSTFQSAPGRISKFCEKLSHGTVPHTATIFHPHRCTNLLRGRSCIGQQFGGSQSSVRSSPMAQFLTQRLFFTHTAAQNYPEAPPQAAQRRSL